MINTMATLQKAFASTALFLTTAAAQTQTIQPFHVQVPTSELKDLKQRITTTRWPDKETVQDFSQGVKLDRLQALAKYWGTTYDWRKAEAKLNAWPQFTTSIDGIDIYFIHVRSKEKNAMPLIITHGWPGSVFEMLRTIAPLTDPVAYGGKAEDAFDVVLPALPGYGFSGKATTTGWDSDRIAMALGTLMTRLGYTSYVAQGGDWGSAVTNSMGRLAPAGLKAIHISLPAALPRT
ncbi:epoxide hydrolase family protein [Puia sp. P3]|uniref:epoxide hydrolase family protein n=1 Tax=Puia sp. P3 TaxID=3423952 RepID=UPI003D67089A